MKLLSRNYRNYSVIFLFLHLVFIPDLHAAEGDVTLRPILGLGSASSSIPALDGSTTHVGVRLMWGAGESKSAGLEVTRFDIKDGDDFYAVGIVIEQRFLQTFRASIGTVGYFDLGTNSDSPVGLTASIGWAPEHFERFKPYLAIRNDAIFHTERVTITSLSAGFMLEF